MGESRKRLLRELYREADWLQQRSRRLLPRISQPTSIPPLPTALHLYGCVFDSSWAAPITKETEPTPCLVSSATSDSATRLRPQWAVLAPPQKAFGDDVEANEVNPQLKAQALDRDFLWLHDPYFALDPGATIFSGVRDSPTLRGLRKVLGDGGALSPVSQPQLSFHFHAKRNKRKACAIHGATELAEAAANLTPDRRAFRAGWDHTEPLTLPPLCSCPDSTDSVPGHLAILRRLEASNGSTNTPSAAKAPPVPESTHLPDPPTPLPREEPLSPPDATVQKDQQMKQAQASHNEAIVEMPDPIAAAAAFLEERKVCSQCGGLQYFPFSFIEIPLYQEMSGLVEVCERIPLPLGTDVFTDGPKVTACMIAKTPKQEWEIYKALYAVNEHHNAAIYDICSIHFYPGYQVSELYWSRHIPWASPLPRVDQNSPNVASPAGDLPSPAPPSVDATSPTKTTNRTIPHTENYPLRPPQQFPLNLCHTSPPPFCSRIPVMSFTAPQLRRIFCIGRRRLPPDFDPSEHITAEDVAAIDEAHRVRLGVEAHNKVQTEVQRLRRSVAGLEKQLTHLKLEAAVIRVRDPKASAVAETPSVNRISRLQVVNGPNEDRGQGGGGGGGRSGSPYRSQRDRVLNDRRFQRGYMPPQGSAAASRLRGSRSGANWK